MINNIDQSTIINFLSTTTDAVVHYYTQLIS